MTIRHWRSLLFVPGNRADLATKTPRYGADLVVLDLEDAVPPAAKESARHIAAEAAHLLTTQVPTCIRVNPPGTPWLDDDVAGLPGDLAAVVVPKLESRGQLAQVAQALEDRPVVAGIETVRGVLEARELLRAPVVACYFGAEDYVADLGGRRTESNLELLTARALVGMAARLARIPALDMVTLDLHDEERFLREAKEACAMGYAGKVCIHPRQVSLARQAFAPSPGEIDRARRLLAAFEEAGGAVVAFEGQMVDEVVAAQARSVLAAAQNSDA